MGGVTYASLEEVAMHRRIYPAELLKGCETGLILFAAAFLGHNDAIHFAQADVLTTCVDTDARRLREMRKLYPPGWAFVTADVWTYAEAARREELTWQAVSLDPFTGPTMERVLESLELWTDITERVLIIGAPLEVVPPIPEGWVISYVVERSEIAAWLVLERAA